MEGPLLLEAAFPAAAPAVVAAPGGVTRGPLAYANRFHE